MGVRGGVLWALDGLCADFLRYKGAGGLSCFSPSVCPYRRGKKAEDP